jgi:hypothetical protein
MCRDRVADFCFCDLNLPTGEPGRKARKFVGSRSNCGFGSAEHCSANWLLPEPLAVICRKNRKLTLAMNDFIQALKQPVEIPSLARAGEGGAAG